MKFLCSLRATYGRSYLENAVHGSSTQGDAKRCIQWIFLGAANDNEEDSGKSFKDPLRKMNCTRIFAIVN